MITYLKLFLISIYVFVCAVLAMAASIVDRTHFLYFRLSKIFSKGVLLIGNIKLKLIGLENIRRSGTYVFVSNHSSQFDIPALQFAVPNNFSIVYKKELAKIPIFGWQLKMGPHIIIDRQNAERALKSIEKAKKIMTDKNFSVLLFAEGTRSRTGEIQPFKRGAFYLAAKVGFPIIPVTISGSQKILPKGKFRIKPGTITINFDKPIETDRVKSRQDEMNLMDRVREIIMKNHIKE